MTEGITYNHDIKDLVVYPILEHFPVMPMIPHFDFTTIGLRTETPTFTIKGVKETATYTYNSVLAVNKIFNYNGTGLWLTFQWMTNSQEVGIKKIEFKPLNVVEIAKIEKKNRDRSITYLQAAAIGTPIEPHVNTILKHYKYEVELFIQNGTSDFEDAINAETNPAIVPLLDIVVGVHPDGAPLKVKDSILMRL